MQHASTHVQPCSLSMLRACDLPHWSDTHTSQHAHLTALQPASRWPAMFHVPCFGLLCVRGRAVRMVTHTALWRRGPCYAPFLKRMRLGMLAVLLYRCVGARVHGECDGLLKVM